jgi:hypothetical protein
MNAHEREWESLADLWRESREEIHRAPLRQMVASHRRRLAAVAAGEVLAVAGFAWLSWLSVRDGIVLWEAVWLSTLWGFTAVAVPFAWWNRRGAWNAIAESAAEYQRQRAARRIRSLRFGCALFAAEAVAVAAELAWFDRFTPLAAALLGLLTLLTGAWALWMKNRAAHELATAHADRDPA